jgi:para-aminobenzoate synthetase component 1
VSDHSPLETPVVEELGPSVVPHEAFQRLAGLPHAMFLDSALRQPELGRYSFVAADPFDFLIAPTDGSDAISRLAEHLAGCSAVTRPDLPPFQGGAAGLFSYELARSLERIPGTKYDEFDVPALAVGFYDVVLATDHVQSRSWLISQGLPEREPAARRRRAEQRLRDFRRWLSSAAADRSRGTQNESPVDRDALAPQFTTDWSPRLTSNFDAASFRAAVARGVQYIRDGDVFQVNLSQRLLHPAIEDPVSLYMRLRRRNPATFAAYFDLGNFQVLSASPERFLQVRGRSVETRPIKGTRPRTNWPEADLFAADDLLQSEKDRAENVMIVDLLRNDLSRVCRPDSIVVSQLCKLEVYEFVQHLVSAVRGELDEGRTAVDLLRAAFPGGSITGAPKIRAMEIIAEIEPTARGPYCGCLGYLGFDGSVDLNILIRTITAGRGWWQMPVGGGIVAQSHPQREYEETWHKAEGLLRALADR